VLYYIIALVIIALDQLTKWLIVNELEIGERIPVIENVLYITSHRNQGAAWGILQVITVIVVIGLVIYIQKYAKDQRLMGMALGLMLGGAIGNFIDRVIHQEVVDFVQTYIGTYPFPIFNIADSALCVGVALLFIVMLFEGKQEKEKVNEQHRN
jgi:signal peptidase II